MISKIGVMIVGICGATSSTFLQGYFNSDGNIEKMKRGSVWYSLRGEFPDEISRIVFSGWDINNSLDESIKKYKIIESNITLDDKINIFPAVIGSSDYISKVEGAKPTHKNINDAIERIKKDIKTFENENNLDRIIIINLSSPKNSSSANNALWNSIDAYAHASIESGADWVEFTPSDSITDDILFLSEKNESRLAGRDGSTGQTILKLFLKSFFQLRGFDITGWYSTNIIGNNDGKVLSHDDYNAAKLHDKKHILNDVINEDTAHVVNIDYFEPAGDNKEAWDRIHLKGWLESNVDISINWRGQDSYLAAALLLDIIAALIHAEKNGYKYGLITELGLFFKNPLGNDEILFEKLLRNLENFTKDIK